MLTRRGFVGALAVLLSARAAGAAPAAFPSGPVRIVVPFAAGGATDVIARLLAAQLSPLWRQPVEIVNRDGAGGNVGSAMVAKAPADGHTLLVGSLGLAVNRFLYPKLGFDPAADFAPVSLLCRLTNIMVVPAGSPAASVAGFIALAKARPGALVFGSSGAGTSIHLSGELFKRMAGIDITHVPYRGSAPAIADMLRGRVDVMFDNASSALPHIRSGALKALAVTGRAPIPGFVPVPAVAETLPGFEVATWFGLFAPARTPPATLERIAADVAAAVQAPAVRSALQALGAEPIGSPPAALGALLRAETERWGRLIREAGIRLGD